MTNYEYDRQISQKGYKTVCGIDEAGRGPLAGPVYAAAVILDMKREIPGLNDSKKLSEGKREELFEIIKAQAADYSIAFATVQEIESMNILNATFLAMCRAAGKLTVKPEIFIVDGNLLPDALPRPALPVVKGDSLSASIAAASILAKVSRDRHMREIDKEYPLYQFSKHKGYGTALHISLLRQHGRSPVHRGSFLKKILD